MIQSLRPGRVVAINENSSLFSLQVVGESLNQDKVKKITEQDVEKYFKRYEAPLPSKTCNAKIDTFLQLSYNAMAHFLLVDEGKLVKDSNDNLMVRRELGMISGGFSMKCD